MSDSFQHRQLVKARKPHRCESCRRWVSPGERYVAMAGKWDGDFYSVKLCQGCESLWELIWSVEGECANWLDDGVAFNEIMEVGEEMGLICRYRSTQPHQPSEARACAGASHETQQTEARP